MADQICNPKMKYDPGFPPELQRRYVACISRYDPKVWPRGLPVGLQRMIAEQLEFQPRLDADPEHQARVARWRKEER